MTSFTVNSNDMQLSPPVSPRLSSTHIGLAGRISPLPNSSFDVNSLSLSSFSQSSSSSSAALPDGDTEMTLEPQQKSVSVNNDDDQDAFCQNCNGFVEDCVSDECLEDYKNRLALRTQQQATQVLYSFPDNSTDNKMTDIEQRGTKRKFYDMINDVVPETSPAKIHMSQVVPQAAHNMSPWATAQLTDQQLQELAQVETLQNILAQACVIL